MLRSRLIRSPLLLLALALPASAQNAAVSQADPGVFPPGFDQLVYKGLVGNVLDAIPMNPSDRVGLQRTNAVVSNTLFGRSLAVMAGLNNPVLLVGGLVWGIWSATNIRPAEEGVRLAANPDVLQSVDAIVAADYAPASPYGSSATDASAENRLPEPLLVSALSVAAPELTLQTRPRVFKVWLPQRQPAQLQ